MWIFIIITIIVIYILYSFITDREKMIKNVEFQGGIQEKYKILLSYILNNPDSKITQLKRDNIIIRCQGGSDAQFSVTQNFGTVDIDWLSNNGFAGIVKEKWQFRENLDQHEMAKKMMQDIEFKLKHGLRWGTQNEIDIQDDLLENKNEMSSKLIIPSVGIDGITINNTTFQEIETKYGRTYDLVNHNNFSFEMRYKRIGLSCFYKQNDPTKKIYFIEVRKEFGAYDINGLSLNSPISVVDVAILYGRKPNYSTSDNSDYAYINYGSIFFYVYKIDAYSKPAEDTYIKSIGIAL